MIVKGQLGYENPEQKTDTVGSYTVEVHYLVAAMQTEENSPPRKWGQKYAVYA